MTPLIYWMDIIGTIAFAISGAATAVKKNMDIFGVNILALMTATGGGMFRDIIIGDVPPIMFRHPFYVVISIVTANLFFVLLYFFFDADRLDRNAVFQNLLFWFDTLGLAAFTIDGLNAGYVVDPNNLFLVGTLAFITGVGGGLLRDILANELPYILVKHVYALATIGGAILVMILKPMIGKTPAEAIGFAAVILIRFLAKHYKWNLPKIRRS